MIETNSPFGVVLILLFYAFIFVGFPLIIIWKIKSTFRQMKNSEMDWKNDATYRFISNPENKSSIRIFKRVVLLFASILFLGILGLIAYIAITADSRGWIILIVFLIPLLAAMVLTPIIFLLAQNQLKKSRSRNN